jgi:hypothetical protein
VSLLLAIIYNQYHEIDANMAQGLITSINHTGSNVSPVTTTPAINTKLRKSPQIFNFNIYNLMI